MTRSPSEIKLIRVSTGCRELARGHAYEESFLPVALLFYIGLSIFAISQACLASEARPSAKAENKYPIVKAKNDSFDPYIHLDRDGLRIVLEYLGRKDLTNFESAYPYPACREQIQREKRRPRRITNLYRNMKFTQILENKSIYSEADISGDTIVVTTHKSLGLSTDSGKAFSELSAYWNFPIYNYFVKPMPFTPDKVSIEGDRIIIQSLLNYPAISFDTGKTWTTSPFEPFPYARGKHPLSQQGSRILIGCKVGADKGKLLISEDGGKHFSPWNTALGDIRILHISQSGSSICITSDEHCFYSPNGASWRAVEPAPRQTEMVMDMGWKWHLSHDNDLFILYKTDELLVSENAGKTWNRVARGHQKKQLPPGFLLNAIVYQGAILASDNLSIYFSANKGATWKRVGGKASPIMNGSDSLVANEDSLLVGSWTKDGESIYQTLFLGR